MSCENSSWHYGVLRGGGCLGYESIRIFTENFKLWYNIVMINTLRKVQNIFNKPSIEEQAAYQHKMPQTVRVDVSYDKKTKHWTAKVTAINGSKVPGSIITESKTEEGLVHMINDAVLTYLDFPEYMKPSMPSLLPEDINFARKTSRSTGLVFAK